MPDFGAFDLGRALWAIGLSVALWFVVQAELNPERSEVFEIGVEARNLPTGLIVTNESEWRTVEVRLTAPRDVFAQLRASQLRAYADLSRAGPGEATFPVTVPAPDPQVRVGDFTPRRIVVRLDEVARKSVPVQVRLAGSLPFGYSAGRASATPDSVSIAGPANFVRRVELAEVEVRLDSVTGDVNTTLSPSLLNAQAERIPASAPGLELQPGTVRVQVPISQQISYREVGVRPTLSGSAAPGYWVRNVAVDPSVVTVIGEPFKRLFNQGIILGEDNEKMSKSRGNVVNPDDYVHQMGADTVRTYLMFLGPWSGGGPWNSQGIQGPWRFLNSVWDLVVGSGDERAATATPAADEELTRLMHRSTRIVTERYEAFQYNTMLAELHTYRNGLQRLRGQVAPERWRDAIERLVLLLAPAAPHLAEELWHRLGHTESVHRQPWPTWDSALTVENRVSLVIQINGKVRDQMDVDVGLAEDAARALALERPKIRAALDGREVRRVIYVPNRLVNLVVA